jgi:uncharacterized membrane protein
MLILSLSDSLLIDIQLPVREILTYGIGSIATFAILFILYLISNQIVKKFEKRPDNEIASKLRKNLKVPIVLLIIIFALWLPLSFTEVPEIISNAANKILTILLIAIFAWILIKLVNLIKYFVLKQYDIDRKDNLKARKVYTQFRIIERILVFLIILVAISLALMTFGEIRRYNLPLHSQFVWMMW